MREFLLILHLLGLAIGVGVSFTHFFLRMSRSKMNKEEATKDAIRALSLGIMIDIGMTLLIVSGLFLMKPFWAILFDSHLLMAKLSSVIILLVLLVIIRINGNRALKENGGPALKRIKTISNFTLPLAVLIIVFAVLMFH
jgi:uncharacterized membrane protein